MTKIRINLTADAYKIDEAKNRGINLSQMLDNVLTSIMSQDEKGGINVRELHQELKNLRKERDTSLSREIEIITLIKEGERITTQEDRDNRKKAEKFVDAIQNSGGMSQWDL